MLRFALSFTLISAPLISFAFAAAPALMPLPVTVRPGTGKLALDATFKAALVSAPDARLDASGAGECAGRPAGRVHRTFRSAALPPDGHPYARAQGRHAQTSHRVL